MCKTNILVVDDEQIVLDSVGKHLSNEEDYRIFKALSVSQALSIMEQNKINIVLTDLMMPEIDGLEFLAMLKEKNPDVLAIMITGYATINSALQAMQLGAFDYIAKPFTRDELKKVVRRAYDLVQVINKSNQEAISEKQIDLPKAISKGIGENTWLMLEEDGLVKIGVERSLLYRLGRIQTVYLPNVYDTLRQGSVFFQIFSTDLRSQALLSPLSGIVVELNEKVLINPDETLQDPYGEGWLIKIKPINFENEIKVIGLG